MLEMVRPAGEHYVNAVSPGPVRLNRDRSFAPGNNLGNDFLRLAGFPASFTATAKPSIALLGEVVVIVSLRFQKILGDAAPTL
jgi:hypothetical protein